jgi:hypothetical protein
MMLPSPLIKTITFSQQGMMLRPCVQGQTQQIERLTTHGGANQRLNKLDTTLQTLTPIGQDYVTTATAVSAPSE